MVELLGVVAETDINWCGDSYVPLSVRWGPDRYGNTYWVGESKDGGMIEIAIDSENNSDREGSIVRLAVVNLPRLCSRKGVRLTPASQTFGTPIVRVLGEVDRPLNYRCISEVSIRIEVVMDAIYIDLGDDAGNATECVVNGDTVFLFDERSVLVGVYFGSVPRFVSDFVKSDLCT